MKASRMRRWSGEKTVAGAWAAAVGADAIAASGIKVALAITVRRDTVVSVTYFGDDLNEDLDDFNGKPPAARITHRVEHCIKTVCRGGSNDDSSCNPKRRKLRRFKGGA